MLERLTIRRNNALRNAYNELISETGVNMRYMKQSTVLDLLMEQSAPRFYITGHIAQLHVNAWLRGKHKSQNEDKQRMAEDLYETFLRVKHENKTLPNWLLWELTVQEPAKSFYMTKHRMKEILFNYKGR